MALPINHDWRKRNNMPNGMRNNLLHTFSPSMYSYTNYSTDTTEKIYSQHKADLNQVLGTSMLHNISQMENPLQKNLGDYTNFTQEASKKTTMRAQVENIRSPSNAPIKLIESDKNMEEKKPTNHHRVDFYPALSGITNFITGFFQNITGAMLFQQNKEPVTKSSNNDLKNPTIDEKQKLNMENQYFDDYCKVERSDLNCNHFGDLDYWEDETDIILMNKRNKQSTFNCHVRDSSPPIETSSYEREKSDCSKNNYEAMRNKTAWAQNGQCVVSERADSPNASTEVPEGRETEEGPKISKMNPQPVNCRAAAGSCEEKLLKLKQIITTKTLDPNTPAKPSSFRRNRPRRVFVDAKSIQVETYEDVPFEEDLEHMESLIANQFISLGLITESELVNVEALPLVKTEKNLEQDCHENGVFKETIKLANEISAAQINEAADLKSNSPASSIKADCVMTEILPLSSAKQESQESVIENNKITPATSVADTQHDLTNTKANLTKHDENKQCEHVEQAISSCEDKLSRLKALLNERKKKTITSLDSLTQDSTRPYDHQKTTENSAESLKTTAKCTVVSNECPKDLPKNSNKSIETQACPKTADENLLRNVKINLASQNLSSDCLKTAIERSETSIDYSKKPPQPERPKKSRELDIPKSKTTHRYKNPNRLDVRNKNRKQLQRNINEDMKFAQAIGGEDLESSIDGSPVILITPPNSLSNSTDNSFDKAEKGDCHFDEVRGRFRSSSTATTDSDDSFQIVFTDSPGKLSPASSPRTRLPSDCGSEDSFIIFEDDERPDCYTNTDVFGDSETTDEDSELSDTETDSDSGRGKSNLLTNSVGNFSRTISDLTDETLYEDGPVIQRAYSDSEDEVEDEVDCSVSNNICVEESRDTGLLLTEAKKRLRKDLPAKTVRFSSQPPQVRVMRVWSYAARQARAGHWQQYSVDAERFKRRITDVDMAISWVLKPQHRNRVKFQRFMPWWNKQKRVEEAEKKAREVAENIKRKEEAKIAEEKRILEEIINEYKEERKMKEEAKQKLLREESNRLNAGSNISEEAQNINDKNSSFKSTDVNIEDENKSTDSRIENEKELIDSRIEDEIESKDLRIKDEIESKDSTIENEKKLIDSRFEDEQELIDSRTENENDILKIEKPAFQMDPNVLKKIEHDLHGIRKDFRKKRNVKKCSKDIKKNHNSIITEDTNLFKELNPDSQNLKKNGFVMK